MSKKIHWVYVFAIIVPFVLVSCWESSVWARAGGGGSLGSRGSRSFSAPQMPSSRPSISPGMSSPNPGSPGQNSYTTPATPPSGGIFSRSPFMQGLAGGLAGGMLGSLLFGGSGNAYPGGLDRGGGGVGLLDLLILGGLLYLAYRFFRRQREQSAAASHEYRDASGTQGYSELPHAEPAYGSGATQRLGSGELEEGLAQIKRYDPTFDEERFKETAQDLFFRTQAGWTNRRLEGIESILTGEMAELFRREFEAMKERGVVNRLENIAIRKVELTEAWQDAGKDYITALFTANLLDYLEDEKTREVVEGDKLNPVKFKEFWTFCRDMSSQAWQLSAVNQVEA
jgi:predicted lipid-binding transport protein (Tim44 family)